MEIVIFWAFVVALIADVISNDRKMEPKNALHLICQTGLFILTGVLLGLIYLIDLWKGEYYWVAFIIVFLLLIGVDIVLHKRLVKKVIHIIGCFVVMGMILYVMLYTRYQLQTRFDQPCWSPNGKQIAFFMEKALYRYGPSMFSFSSPDDIWKKYYICIMDYDGNNFRIIKETEDKGSIMWPSDETIVYNQKIMIDKLHYTKFKGDCYKMHPDGTGLEGLWQYDEKSEYQGVGWVTPDTNYLVLVKIKSTDIGIRLGIYSRKEKKIKKEIVCYGILYGSYKDNTIAISDDRHFTVINLDDLTTKESEWKEKEEFDKLLTGYVRGTISPDRTMYIDDVFRNYNKKNMTTWTKCSYLFNIFGE